MYNNEQEQNLKKKLSTSDKIQKHILACNRKFFFISETICDKSC